MTFTKLQSKHAEAPALPFGCFAQFISIIVTLVYQRMDLFISSTSLCKAAFDRHFF